MGRFYDLRSKGKQEALFRQNFRCAVKGEDLRDVEIGNHHVVPAQCGDPTDRSHRILKDAVNCVCLCSNCHYIVHDSGHYNDGAVAPPEYFTKSHGRNRRAHELWCEEIHRIWDLVLAYMRAKNIKATTEPCSYSFSNLHEAAYGRPLNQDEGQRLMNSKQVDVNLSVLDWIQDTNGLWRPHRALGENLNLYEGFMPGCAPFKQRTGVMTVLNHQDLKGRSLRDNILEAVIPATGGMPVERAVSALMHEKLVQTTEELRSLIDRVPRDFFSPGLETQLIVEVDRSPFNGTLNVQMELTVVRAGKPYPVGLVSCNLDGHIVSSVKGGIVKHYERLIRPLDKDDHQGH